MVKRFPYRRWFSLLLLSAFASACADRQRPQAPGEESLLITGVSIIDPEANRVSPPRDVLITNGMIIEVADGGAISADRASIILSADGMFAMAGLIDVHAHIGDGGLGALSEEDRQGALSQFVRYGVTTVFVPGGGGGNGHQLAQWKERCDAREFLCPGLYGSGALITAPGSHPIGTIWDMPEDVDPAAVYARGGVAIAEAEPAGPLLDRKLAMGVDAIKIVIEDGPGPWFPKPRLSTAKIAELVQASHERGMRIFAHVSRLSHVEDAVAAGVDGVMHSAEDPVPDTPYMASFGRDYLLTAMRIYDVRSKRWNVAWMANGAGLTPGLDVGTFEASSDDGRLVMTSPGSSEMGEQRVVFSEIDENSFLWESEFSSDGGETWQTVMRVKAKRRGVE